MKNNFQIFDRSYLSVRSQTSIINRLKLHSHELSIIGLPIYSEKRMLVEKVFFFLFLYLHLMHFEGLNTD